MEIVAFIHTDFPEKFGIPRQSGLVNDLTAKITFTPPYNHAQAIKGIDGFEYLWLLWQFQHDRAVKPPLSVRPPRLGGNQKMGVFATRSPFRPNGIGLSSVKLLKVGFEGNSPVLYVSGADLRDQTPIYDIKPYLPFTDSHPDAACGFAGEQFDYALQVECPETLLLPLSLEQRAALLEILRQDPRPSYQNDSERLYGMCFAGFNIKFRVDGAKLYVLQIEKDCSGCCI